MKISLLIFTGYMPTVLFCNEIVSLISLKYFLGIYIIPYFRLLNVWYVLESCHICIYPSNQILHPTGVVLKKKFLEGLKHRSKKEPSIKYSCIGIKINTCEFQSLYVSFISRFILHLMIAGIICEIDPFYLKFLNWDYDRGVNTAN